MSKKATIIVFSPDLDKVLAAFNIALGAATAQMQVTMFFTFWGLNVIRKRQSGVSKPDFIRKAFGIINKGGADRLKLLAGGGKYILFSMGIAYLASGVSRGGYSTDAAFYSGSRAVINILLIYIAGTVAGPLLLPWIPGRSFSLKGFLTGVLFFMIAYLLKFTGSGLIETAAWFLLIVSVVSFILMNFTGASTYTSLSGVRKEMRVAVPLQLFAVVAGIVLVMVNKFV